MAFDWYVGATYRGLIARESVGRASLKSYAPAVFVALGARTKTGGADRDRTDDLLHAMQALFQLSYGPKIKRPKSRSF